MSQGRSAKGDAGRASAEHLPGELQTRLSLEGGREMITQKSSKHQFPPGIRDNPPIIVEMPVSGKLFLSLPSRGGESSSNEGVIKYGEIKAQLSRWLWTMSATHTSVCS